MKKPKKPTLSGPLRPAKLSLATSANSDGISDQQSFFQRSEVDGTPRMSFKGMLRRKMTPSPRSAEERKPKSPQEINLVDLTPPTSESKDISSASSTASQPELPTEATREYKSVNIYFVWFKSVPSFP